jgi:hypothetical protein
MMSPRVPLVGEPGSQSVWAGAGRDSIKKRLMIHLLVPQHFSIVLGEPKVFHQKVANETYASIISPAWWAKGFRASVCSTQMSTSFSRSGETPTGVQHPNHAYGNISV